MTFLLELRSEEIPARMQPGARAELERLFRAQVDAAGLAVASVRTLSTPRRLALIADLAPATEGSSEERKGPRADAPDKAIEGFLRSTGLTRDQLEEREVKGQAVLFAVTQKPARPAAEVLAEAIPAIVRDFSWPKSMRWGEASTSTESLRWVRPLHGIVALLDGEVVPCEAAGIASGRETRGHRFHAPGPLSIDSAESYEAQLRAAHVIADPAERRRIIAEGAERLAADAGLALVANEGLVAENVGLTEWPVPLMGRFDADSLTLPPEVIQLTARVNQKYFVTENPPRNGEGDHAKHGGGVPGSTLANAFVLTANIDASDGGAAIVAGNEKVLAARLSDACFFWDADLAVPLEEQAAKLDRIVFHEKLGTVADKVDRVAKLARWLVEEGVVKPSAPLPSREGLGVGGDGEAEPLSGDAQLAPLAPTPDPSLEGRGELADLAERAARLCKADLVTGTVTEFPELQGIAGGHLALAQGEEPEVAAAIRDHYKPVGPDDEVPTAPVTVAVSLADKLDTIASFFVIGELPTGSKDPFALRRAALGVLHVIMTSSLSLNMRDALFVAQIYSSGTVIQRGKNPAHRYLIDQLLKVIANLGELTPEMNFELLKLEMSDVPRIVSASWEPSFAFFVDRLKVQQREAGVRHDLIDAVFALGGEDDLVRLIDRTRALQQFVETDEGADLLAGYKRSVNILKKEGVDLGTAPADAAPESTADAEADPAPDAVIRTGEEDPLALVDSPSVTGAVAAMPHEDHDPAGDAEEVLGAALTVADYAVAEAVEKEEWANAMASLASLRQPIDRFFEHATVNDPDPAVRERRLGLLVRVRDIMHRVADFSQIEG